MSRSMAARHYQPVSRRRPCRHRRAGVPVTYLHEQPGFAYDPALGEVARTMDVPTARWTAKVLEYPTAGLRLSGPRWPWALTLRPFLLGLTGLAITIGTIVLLRRKRLGAGASSQVRAEDDRIRS